MSKQSCSGKILFGNNSVQNLSFFRKHSSQKLSVFRNNSIQNISFSGTVLFRSHPFQEQFLSENFPYWKLFFSETILFGNYSFQKASLSEMILLRIYLFPLSGSSLGRQISAQLIVPASNSLHRWSLSRS